VNLNGIFLKEIIFEKVLFKFLFSFATTKIEQSKDYNHLDCYHFKKKGVG